MGHQNEQGRDGCGHGGDLRRLARQAGCAAAAILDFSANINPLGPPPWLREVIGRCLDGVVNYPDPRGEEFAERLAATLVVDAAQLVPGNGATELLYAAARAMGCRRAVLPVPAYLDYERAARGANLEVYHLSLAERQGFRLDFAALAPVVQSGDLVFLGRPNNPTGAGFAAAPLLELALARPGALFVVDESFFEFMAGESELISRTMPANLLVVRSLTKFYAIPGLRLGYAVGAAGTTARLRRQIPPWSVNSLALAVGEGLAVDREYAARSRAFVLERRSELAAGLAALPGLALYPGAANFLLLRLEHPDLTAACLAARLLGRTSGRPIAIRVCANYPGLDYRFFRVAVRTAEDNEELVAALARALTGHSPGRAAGAARRTGRPGNCRSEGVGCDRNCR